ncbi:MAG: exodeoxyribonuclease VII large subunit [Lachnospiraceae bacterium]|jgi:exodeoxyribonuclease VII large subunit
MSENRNVYTVKQVNSYVKRMFEDDFVLRSIYIRGELSNCKYHHSGHIYFSLKDESGVIPGVMFSSNAAGLKFRLTDGMQVIVHGSISVYERDGRYQIYARSMEQDGQGDLYRQFEELKKRLGEMGMFSEMYKKPIPRYGMNIGVVTAKTGAVIRDIYNVSSRRNPYCKLTLYPAQVQGEEAARTICRGIEILDEMGLDCIIVGRGGGSMEDLWCFNDERVARAIFNAKTPIISAVGHESDFTIADFVADLRAPTPSAAAELAVFDYNRFLQDLDNYRNTMDILMENKLKAYGDRLELCRLRLARLSPQNMLTLRRQRLQDAAGILDNIMQETLRSRKERLIVAAERLRGLSPLKRLAEGYAFVTGEGGRAVRTISKVSKGDILNIMLSDGKIEARTENIQEAEYE